MDYRRLGDSDLEVSEICLGSFLTYGVGVGREQTEACTDAAFDAGINFFDTANVYGKGAAEIFLDGRTPLVQTLQVLQSEVGALIDALSLAFK